MALVQTFNEWITLGAAHELLGTSSTGDDVEVSGMIADLSSLLNSYLQRDVRHCEYSETITRPNSSFIMVNNWPIISITSITSDGVSVTESEFDIDEDLGIMYFAEEGISFTGVQPKKIVLQYICGYDPIPLELQVIFRTLLQERYTSEGSASVDTTGDIKKVSLVGVAAVEFDTSGSSVSYSGVDRLSGVPEELKPYIGVLDRYRSDRLIGII